MRVRVLEDAAAVAREAAQLVAADLRDGARTLVLAGGSTPRSAYELLAAMDLEWGRVLILFGDERCLPPTDPESNYAMAKGALLDKIAPAGVLRIAAELGPEVAASDYDRLLQDMGQLDLVLLGMGEDGHCASLFPDSPQLQSTALVAAVRGAPKPPAERVTLTLRAFNEARRVVFMATGQGKAVALQRAQRGEVPAGRIAGAEFLVDRAAAGAL
ncbi:MAG TPA: 6-phosphogluconolactonase [Candidatus Acidoferrales bacterium]|nr:6-phosphogluconolactonase [Candidatus Acidoferrales bacterium]